MKAMQRENFKMPRRLNGAPIPTASMGLRLPREVKILLEKRAIENNRSLHGELVHTLTESVGIKLGPTFIY